MLELQGLAPAAHHLRATVETHILSSYFLRQQFGGLVSDSAQLTGHHGSHAPQADAEGEDGAQGEDAHAPEADAAAAEEERREEGAAGRWGDGLALVVLPPLWPFPETIAVTSVLCDCSHAAVVQEVQGLW